MMITSQTMLSKIGGTHLNADITLLKKDPFAPDINEIYCVMYGNELYKFKVFMRFLNET